jgi:hypothetical protein
VANRLRLPGGARFAVVAKRLLGTIWRARMRPVLRSGDRCNAWEAKEAAETMGTRGWAFRCFPGE